MSRSKGSLNLPLILEKLHARYPGARYELEYSTPLQLLVATILAAQCTDERVNQVTRTLFKKYRDARAFAQADVVQLGEDVKSTGYYREKAKAIKEACQILEDDFGGQVPKTVEELTTLPRVARKTANVVLTQAFGLATGIVVDSHVARVVQRLGLVEEEKPEKIETELLSLVPKSEWIFFGPAVILHGRYTCTASDPQCGSCVLADVCAKRGVDAPSAEAPKSARLSKRAEASAVPDDEDEEEKPVPRKRSPAPAPARPTSTAKGSEMKLDDIPDSWRTALAGEFDEVYFHKLKQFVDEERRRHEVFPPEEDVFNALKFTPLDEMKVLLLGQDPYHDNGQAHGLCFSVRAGIKPPPSLVNMFKELRDDLGCRIPNHGCLEGWARQGVLLLNAVLTVRAHEPNSHKDQGWERFTDAIIQAASERTEPIVFVLWGAYAQKKEKLIDGTRHVILKSAHPSPLSAKKFFGSRPFSAVNDALKRLGQTPINWQLKDL